MWLERFAAKRKIFREFQWFSKIFREIFRERERFSKRFSESFERRRSVEMVC